jgi:hypothetical protein
MTKVSTLAIVNRMNKNSDSHVNFKTGKAYKSGMALKMDAIKDDMQYTYKIWDTQSAFEDTGLTMISDESHEINTKSGVFYRLYNIEQTNAQHVYDAYQASKPKSKNDSLDSNASQEELIEQFTKKILNAEKLLKQMKKIVDKMKTSTNI